MFKKILVGVILISFNPRIGGLSLMPDFIGYFVIASGLSELTYLSPRFHTARALALVLGVLSIPSIFEVKIEINDIQSLSQIGWWHPFSTILGLVAVILYFFFAYNLYIGLHELGLKNGCGYLADKSKAAWHMLLVVTFLSLGMVLFALLMLVLALAAGPSSLAGLAGIAILLVIFVIILLVFVIIAFVYEVQAILEASRQLESGKLKPIDSFSSSSQGYVGDRNEDGSTKHYWDD